MKKNIFKMFSITLFLFISIIYFTGCTSFIGQVPRDEKIDGLNLDLAQDGESLKKSAVFINEKSKLPEVKREATKIQVVAERLVTEKSPKAEAMKDHIQSLEKQIAEYSTAKERYLQNMFLWMIIIGIIAVIAGIAVIVVSKMALAEIGTAISLVGGCISILGLGLYMFYWWIALIAMIGIGLTILIVFIRFWRSTNMLNDFAQNINDVKNLSENNKNLVVKKQLVIKRENEKANMFETLLGKKE